MASKGMENQRPVLIGGYDVGFVDKHSSDIESRCPICLLILKDPYYPINCKCGTHFCMTCIDWVYKTKGPSCPMCKEHFEGIAANLELKRALENKEVYCTYKLGGCTWKGALRNLDSHLMDNCCILKQEKFTEDVLKKMSNNDTVERISAVINLAGLPGSGKTTLISRLLGRKFEHDRPSTGICNATITVDLQPAQLYTAELGDHFKWEDFGHYKSLQNQLHNHIPSNVPESDSYPASVVNDDPADNNIKMNDTVKNLIKGLEIDSFKKLAAKGSVYIRDVGGQPEFKHSLSLLVYGPSIFLFVFNACIDIDEEQTIQYRLLDDNKMQYLGNHYVSKMSTKTALLQFLSSVKSIRYTTKGDGQSYEPVVLIVGTHMDLLSEAERLEGPGKKSPSIPTIEQIHDKLKKVIEPDFRDIVCDTTDNKPMFAVNNYVDNDSGLQSLRRIVNNLLVKRQFPHPIKYVLFALDLIEWDRDVLTLKECEELARKFEIDDTSSLLKFFHFHAGTILWFDTEHLRNWVFKDPQFLFNRVTDIILKTYVDPSLGNMAIKTEAQQHGIFKAEELESMLSKMNCELIKPDEFLRFFIHLRLIAEFEDKENSESLKKYFIPSFLYHGYNDHDEHKVSYFHYFLLLTKLFSFKRIKRISPLSFTFACGTSPDGLFGVLVCRLLQDQHKEEGEEISFKPIIKEICKNKVAFKICIAHDMDTVALKMHSSCLDMHFFPEISQPQKRSFPVEKSCCMVHEAMKKCISNSLETLRYDEQKDKHQTSFKCHNEECDQRHVVDGIQEKRIMRCSTKTSNHDRFDLKEEELYWFNEAIYFAQASKMINKKDTQPYGYMWLWAIVAVISIACLAHYLLLGPPVSSQQPILPQENAHVTGKTSSVSLDSRPELPDMLSLNCGKKSLTIIQEVGSRCNTFGIFLGLPLQMVNNEWYAAEARIEPTCQKIVERWLEGNGKPVKWGTVLEALQKVSPILVDDLKTCITYF